jgi:CRP-like cAMP-binding protein
MMEPQLFAHFPQEIQATLRSEMHIQTFAPGESVFHQGTPATAIYAVVRGRVKIARVTPDGYESILCVRQAGEYFCPVPVLDGKVQLGTAIAMTEVTVLWVESETFHALCRECPQLLSAVQGDCLAEVRYLLNRLETFAFRNIKERLAITLLDEIRHQRADENDPIELSMIQQELAGLVGASRESVSRNMKQLERDEIVELHRGKVRILDLRKLRKISTIE